MPAGPEAPPAHAPSGAVLFALGLSTLFLELTLIRYLAGNIWNLGYFPNLVLMAAFIGMGLGFLLHQLVSVRTSFWLLHAATFVLFGLTLFILLARPSVPGFSASRADLGGELFFTSTGQAAERELPKLVVWFGTVVVIFAFVAQRTAKVFRCFPPLRAYTLDIAGSCCGIACFTVMSWAQAPAWTWFAFLAPILLFANLLFSFAFRDQPAPEHMFGWNLLGATLGGCVEYSSMALGYNALATVVIGCYTLCFALLWLARRERNGVIRIR